MITKYKMLLGINSEQSSLSTLPLQSKFGQKVSVGDALMHQILLAAMLGLWGRSSLSSPVTELLLSIFFCKISLTKCTFLTQNHKGLFGLRCKKPAYFGEKLHPSHHLVLLILEAASAFSNSILSHHLHFIPTIGGLVFLP